MSTEDIPVDGRKRGGAKSLACMFTAPARWKDFIKLNKKKNLHGPKNIDFLSHSEEKVSSAWSRSEHLGPLDVLCHIPATCQATSWNEVQFPVG